MKKVIFLLVALFMTSCSYVQYREYQNIEYDKSYVHQLEKPSMRLHPNFEFVDANGRSKSYEELSYDEKIVFETLFPRIQDIKSSEAPYSLKKLVVKKESISNNLTPSFFYVFSVITFGVFPSYITSAFKGHMTIIDNKTGKKRNIQLNPKYVKGMGMLFSLISWRDDWFAAGEDPYRNNLSEYYQNYILRKITH